MTIADLQTRIVALLTEKPLTTGELYGALASSTDATMYDVLYTLRNLFNARRVLQTKDNLKWRLL